MRIKFIALICVALFLDSCSDSAPTVKFVERKDVRVTNLNAQYFFPVGSPVKDNVLVLQDIYNLSSLVSVQLDSSQSIIEGRAVPSFNDLPLQFHQLYYKNEDSLFGFDDDTQKLLLLKGGEVSFSYPFNPGANPQMPLRGSGTFVAIPNSLASDSARSMQESYEAQPIMLYNYKNAVAKPVGVYPQAYISGLKDYYDFSPKVSFNKEGLVYAFGADHYIYSYKEGRELQSFKAKSKYIRHFQEYPEDKNFDLVYLKKYNYEEPRYLDVIYDPFRQLYYRIVKHRSRYRRGVAKLPSNWSVIVLDKNMEKLGEVLFDDPLYSSQIIVPSKDGLYVRKNFKDQASVKPGEMILTLFDLVYE